MLWRAMDRFNPPADPGSFRIRWERYGGIPFDMPSDPDDPDSLAAAARQPGLPDDIRNALLVEAERLRHRI